MFGVKFFGAQSGSKWDTPEWDFEYENPDVIWRYVIDVCELMKNDATAPNEAVMSGFSWGQNSQQLGDILSGYYPSNAKLAA